MYGFILVSESIKRIISDNGWISTKEFYVGFFSSKSLKLEMRIEWEEFCLVNRKDSSNFKFKPYPAISPL